MKTRIALVFLAVSIAAVAAYAVVQFTVTVHASPASGYALSPPPNKMSMVTFTAVANDVPTGTTKRFFFQLNGPNGNRMTNAVTTAATNASWTPTPPPGPGTYQLIVTVGLTRTSDNAALGQAQKILDGYVIKAAP
jgi:hypothetical protein